MSRSKTAQNARLLGASLAALHARLGELLDDGSGTIQGLEGHRFKANRDYLRLDRIDVRVRPVSPLEDLEETPHLAAIRLDWEASDRAFEIALESFRQHKNRGRFNAEVAAIKGIV